MVVMSILVLLFLLLLFFLFRFLLLTILVKVISIDDAFLDLALHLFLVLLPLFNLLLKVCLLSIKLLDQSWDVCSGDRGIQLELLKELESLSVVLDCLALWCAISLGSRSLFALLLGGCCKAELFIA